MSEMVLKTNNVTKKYKNQLANDEVSINVRKGEIYGLIGKNGAGKTTLMRIITGLIHKTSGELELLGAVTDNEIENARQYVGSLIESPCFYVDMNARENLEISRLVRNIAGKTCIDDVLKLVGLENTGKKKFKDFSLGMKQRLGIANAMLGNPNFIILDEPINGLDPMGIVEVRELLKKINVEKDITILISSHILGELSELATCYGIMSEGKLVEEITAEELKNKCRKYIYLEVDNSGKAITILENEFDITDYEVLEQNKIRIFESLDKASLINSTLAKNDVLVEKIGVKGENLEEYFVGKIGGNINA